MVSNPVQAWTLKISCFHVSLAPILTYIICIAQIVFNNNLVKCEMCQQDRKSLVEILSEKEELRLRNHLEKHYANYRDNEFLLDQAINHLKNTACNQIFIYTNSGPFNFLDHLILEGILLIPYFFQVCYYLI